MRALIALFPAATLLLGLATGVRAQDGPAVFDIGGDAFRAGSTVLFEAEGVDDLFMVGETVRARSAIAGSAHVAGRVVTLSGDVGGDLYAAGMEVEVTGAVAGDATVTGYDVSIGSVGGDLRLSGSDLSVEGPVDGYAIIAGDEVEIDASIAGDVTLAARRVAFDDGARIGGTLTVYEDSPGTLEVPESVVPADRVLRREIEEWDGAEASLPRPSAGRWVAKFLMGVIVVAVLAAGVAALLPEQLAGMRRRVLARPFGTLWMGFLGLSVLVGAAILLAVTLVGIVLSPAALLAAAALWLAGYVIGAYALGVGLVMAFGRAEPADVGDKAVAAGIGALVAGVLALIPFLGWLFAMALTLAGAGAIIVAWADPRFFGRH